MPYTITPISLELPTSLSHHCWTHTSRDGHLIGVIAFESSQTQINWFDLEYIRRRTDEFAVMAFPDYISALIIDLRGLTALLDTEAPIFPWRLTEEDCPIRILVHYEQRAHYSAVFEPAWLAWDLQATLKDLRDFFDMNYH